MLFLSALTYFYYLSSLYLWIGIMTSKQACPICYSSSSQEICKTDCCNTYFGVACLERWIDDSDTCPMCRCANPHIKWVSNPHFQRKFVVDLTQDSPLQHTQVSPPPSVPQVALPDYIISNGTVFQATYVEVIDLSNEALEV